MARKTRSRCRRAGALLHGPLPRQVTRTNISMATGAHKASWHTIPAARALTCMTSSVVPRALVLLLLLLTAVTTTATTQAPVLAFVSQLQTASTTSRRAPANRTRAPTTGRF